MKELVFILFIFLFNLSYEANENIATYNFNKTSNCVEVTLPSDCQNFYIWIDQKEAAVRVHKENEESNVWNEIRVRRKNTELTKFDYEIGIIPMVLLNCISIFHTNLKIKKEKPLP